MRQRAEGRTRVELLTERAERARRDDELVGRQVFETGNLDEDMARTFDSVAAGADASETITQLEADAVAVHSAAAEAQAVLACNSG